MAVYLKVVKLFIFSKIIDFLDTFLNNLLLIVKNVGGEHKKIK